VHLFSKCGAFVVMQFIYEVFYMLRRICGTGSVYGVVIFKKKSIILSLRSMLTLSGGVLLQLSWKDHYSSWLCELNPQGISCDEYGLNGATQRLCYWGQTILCSQNLSNSFHMLIMLHINHINKPINQSNKSMITPITIYVPLSLNFRKHNRLETNKLISNT
jgi:hypothetical protein